MRLTFLVVLATAPHLVSAERPASGKSRVEYAEVDTAVRDHMDRLGATAAVVAVSRNGELLYSRGYGWKDQGKKKAVEPDALFRIASISKPFTVAAVRASVRAGRLSLDDKAFDVVKIKGANGKLGDQRMGQITVRHLLAHSGGWDSDLTYDPMFYSHQVTRTLGQNRHACAADMVQWVVAKPLDFAPGERCVYSNFGYCVLGRVLEASERQGTYFGALEALVLKPGRITDVMLATTKPHPREVWYPVSDALFRIEVMDAHGGLVASAPAVCRFLDQYWINGEPREKGESRSGAFFGSIPGTSAMVRQRLDGVNVVVLFNNRRADGKKDDSNYLERTMDAALDSVFKK